MKTGMRAIDTSVPQLSMYRIRAPSATKVPWLAVLLFGSFFERFESGDGQLRSWGGAADKY